MATTRYDEEEQRRRKPASLAPRAGIAPSGMPGVPGVPARPAPAAGGIAPPPKYGGMDYMRADGSRRIVDEEGDRNVVTVPGAGPVEVPSSTPMSVTPNRESGITAASPAVSEFDPRAGEVRTAPATGAQVQMPAEAWRRYDAANAARRAGIAPQLPAEPGDQPGGTNAYARAAGLFAASTQRPGMVSEGGGRLAEIQKQREAEMDRSRYGLMRPGATSANNRAWDAARRDDARAADRRSMVEGQQSVEREGHQLAAAASVAGSLFKSRAAETAAREAGGAARAVAATQAGADKYAAEKALEGKKAEVEAETIRYNRDRDDRLDREDAERRALIAKAEQERIDKNTMSFNDLDKIIGDNGGMVPLVRDVLNNPDINDGEKRRRLHNLSQKLYGRDANYIMGIYKDVAPYVDIRNQRAGVQGSGKPLPGAKWEKR